MKYAVINVLSNQWEFESSSLTDATAMLLDLRQTGVKCVLVKIVIDEDEDIPTVPNIFDNAPARGGEEHGG
jgi:hypothetical protein